MQPGDHCIGHERQALARAVVDDGQDVQAPAVGHLVGGDVGLQRPFACSSALIGAKRSPMPARPTVPPPEPNGLNRVLSRNIQELQERRSDERRAAGFQERVAASITGFAGRMPFA